MATYEEIYGKRVKEFDSDPTLDSTYEGQVWYNTGNGVLKSVVSFSAFIAGGPLNTQRSQVAGAGTKTSGLAIGGTQPSSTAPSRTNGNKTESYNGFVYTNETNCPLYKRQGSGLGTQTAALFFGGYDDPQGYEATSAEFDGSSWTSGGTYPSDIDNMSGGSGTLTAGWNAGGYVGPPGVTNGTYNYDGSSWTASGNLPYAASNVNNLGPQTAGMAAGGNKQPGIGTDWSFYDGSSWTAQSAVSAPVQANGTAGTQTNAILYGGFITTASNSVCLEWDGSAWATNPATLATSRGLGAHCGVSTSINDGFMSGGDVGETTVYSATEEFNKSINTITKAAWASGNNLNNGRNAGAGFGVQTAAVMTTGNEPGETNKTEHYDGTSWTNATNYPISKRFTAASGTLTSGLVAGGSPAVATVNKYDGTNWTAANSLPTSTDGGVMFGTQTASVYSVGRNPSATTTTYEFDGTNWTAGGAAGTARYFLASSGTLTAGLMFGGQGPGPSIKSETEEYDGTSWSESGDLGTARYGVGGSSAGTQTDTIAFAGNNPAVVLTEGYDGTSWSTRPNMATARRFISGAGTATAGLGFGGNPPNNSTEEFTGETETANVTDFTTS